MNRRTLGDRMLLEGKNAVIYGGGGSAGSAVVRSFAREGASVFLAGRTQAPLDAAAEAIQRAGGIVETARVDALDETAVVRHIDAIAETAGSVDVSFNAIAVDHDQVALADLSVEQIVGPVARRIATHLLTARAAARHMTAQGSGVILTFSADAARLPYPNIGGFGIACAAVEGLTRSLAAELGAHGVRVVCLRSMGSPESHGVQDVWQQHFGDAHSSTEDVVASRAQGTFAAPRADPGRSRQRRRAHGFRPCKPTHCRGGQRRVRRDRRLTVTITHDSGTSCREPLLIATASAYDEVEQHLAPETSTKCASRPHRA